MTPVPGWIAIGERLPEAGAWEFYDTVAPHEGCRRSRRVPVLLRGGEEAWAEFFETTSDHGKTVEAGGWSAADDLHGDEEVTVTHWFSAPGGCMKMKMIPHLPHDC